MGGSHETPFKMKGSGHYGLGNSSPAKNAPGPPDHKHPHLTNEQSLAAANRRKKEGIENRMSKYNVDEKKATEIWTKQNPPLPQPK